MSNLYERVKGRKFEEFIALIPEVQADVEDRTFEMAIHAEADLKAHVDTGDSYVTIEHGDIDWYVVLSDERGQDAAMTIEFGRAGYVDPENGKVWGQMDGLFILANATRIAKKRSKRLPRERRRNPGWHSG